MAKAKNNIKSLKTSEMPDRIGDWMKSRMRNTERRPTLVCGSAGCGKTLLAMEFLVRGAAQYNEPESLCHLRNPQKN